LVVEFDSSVCVFPGIFIDEFGISYEYEASVIAFIQSRRGAFTCSFLLLLCAVLACPFAEIGMIDDWSYVQSARVLAQTGHIVYNGWATAMLGWQLYLGALFAKLYGPSFTAIRASTLFVGLLTAFIAQRSMVRAGLNNRNATGGTLLLVLSPMYLPLSVSFMSDIGGLFCIVFCFCACVRALQGCTDLSRLAWLAAAALSSAIGGTVRQIAWLGVLVMFPCAVWLVRKTPRAVPLGVFLYVLSAVTVFICMRWFAHQPYAVPEPLIQGNFNRALWAHFCERLYKGFFTLVLFLSPLLIGFARGISFKRRLTTLFICLPSLAFGLTMAMLAKRHKGAQWEAPYLQNYFTEHGLIDYMHLHGERPIILGTGIRILLSTFVVFSLLVFVAFLFTGKARAASRTEPVTIGKNSLLLLLVPFFVAYCALLSPRCYWWGLLDRYFLPLIFVAIVLLGRYFQTQIRPDLPLETFLAVASMGLFSIIATYDAFSMYRAREAAVRELEVSGVPATEIDAGFEHDGMTQIEVAGHTNDPRIRIPTGTHVDQLPHFPENCRPQFPDITPIINPKFALSFDPNACGGPSGFPPVPYHEWLGPHTVNIYIVKTRH
jgi:hypothetical protein